MIVDLVMVRLIFNKHTEVPRLSRADDLKGVGLASRTNKLKHHDGSSLVFTNTLQFDNRALLLVIYSTTLLLARLRTSEIFVACSLSVSLTSFICFVVGSGLLLFAMILIAYKN
jgi:hypothetical protein